MKNKNRFFGVLLVLGICFTAAACTQEEKQEEEKSGDSYTIYFLEDNTFHTREYLSDTEDSSELALELLSQMGLVNMSQIQNGNVYVNTLNVSNGVAYVYFNSAYSKMDNVYEVLFRASVVKTLSQLREVNYVYFYTNNKPLAYENGQVVGLMAESDFIAESDSELQNLAWSTVTLYFASAEGTGLVRKNIDVAYAKTVSLEKVIIEQLIQGPDDEDSLAVIPSQVKVLGTTVRNGICYVNLDSSFAEEKLGIPFELTIYSVVNSLCELNYINKVQFQINGESHTEVNGISFEQYFERNLDLVEEGI